MQINTKLVAAAISLLAIVIAVVVLNEKPDGNSTIENEVEKCVMVLGPSGLFCGEAAIVRAVDDEFGRFDRDRLRAVVKAQGEETILLVRSEVPYGWFRSVLQQFRQVGGNKFEVRLETSVCHGIAKDGRATEVLRGKGAIRARSFTGKLVPRSIAADEDGPDIVGVQPFGVFFEFEGVRAGPGASCDKELFSFCEPDARPKKFLDEFAALRRTVQEDEHDVLGLAKKYERRRVEASKVARTQYPFETMRAQLGDYWPGVQLEVLDEVPMTVVLEVIDALDYARSYEERGYTQNLANSLEVRCQDPGEGIIDVMVLPFSEDDGVLLEPTVEP